jgi:hypothetical protein
MNNLIAEPDKYAKKINSSEYPLLTIIRKCFGEYNDGAIYKNIGVITDMYCYNNEMKYSFDTHDTFPDIFKYAKYYDKNGETIEIKEITKPETKPTQESNAYTNSLKKGDTNATIPYC